MTGGGAPRQRALLGLFVGVMAVSAAAIFIRLAEAPPVAMAFWRTFLSAVVLVPLVLVRRERWPRGRDLARTAAAGLCLALHFGLWIASLDHTSVAASVVLVCTQPVFVAVLARVLLGEATPPVVWAGIAVALAGVALIASAGASGEARLLGDALALAGAVAIAAYVLVGRSVRAADAGLLAYSAAVYLFAAAFLLPASLLLGERVLGYAPATWGYVAATALLPQLVGHTLLNQALRRLPASVVSGSILLEPVVSTALAWLLLEEAPLPATILGGVVVLLGLFLLVRARPSTT